MGEVTTGTTKMITEEMKEIAEVDGMKVAERK